MFRLRRTFRPAATHDVEHPDLMIVRHPRGRANFTTLDDDPSWSAGFAPITSSFSPRRSYAPRSTGSRSASSR